MKFIDLFNDPIIAISTSLGFSGINIIRISGNSLWFIIKKICNKNKNNLKPRYSYYVSFKDYFGNLIDKGLIIFFSKPYSYTGEDIFEFHIHGGFMVVKILLNICLKFGKKLNLRLAKPGEFTKRAFLNNKINFTQIKSLINLINSSNFNEAKYFIDYYSGFFDKFLFDINESIKKLRIMIEANIDFLDYDLNFLKINDILLKILKRFDYVYFKFLKSICFKKNNKIVIIGRPNVGKSSLFNLFTNSNYSIVTDISGTTRDKIEKLIKINNLNFNIVDTAGIKNLTDVSNSIELIGIKKTFEEINNSNIIIYVFDISRGLSLKDKNIIKFLPINIIKIFVWNKIDLINKNLIFILFKKYFLNFYLSIILKKNFYLLKTEIKKYFFSISNISNYFIFDVKYLSIVDLIKKKINEVLININKENFLFDLFAEDLKYIQKKIYSLNQNNVSIDVLDEIFSKYCIGK